MMRLVLRILGHSPCGLNSTVNVMMMMIMMIRGFVERVINSPQTRCRSAKQVAFKCRANVRGERDAERLVNCTR